MPTALATALSEKLDQSAVDASVVAGIANWEATQPPPPVTPVTVSISDNVVNANAVANTLMDITGLSFPVSAGNRYRFVFHIPYESVTTNGSRWSVSGPASPTKLNYRSEYSLTAGTATLNAGLTTYDLPTGTNATSVAAGTGDFAIITGFIQPSVSGIVIGRFASETASTPVTVLAGASVQYVNLS